MVRTIKMLILAAMAMVAIAAVGVGSASATVLCKENVSTCAEKDIYPSGTSISGSLQGSLNFYGELPLECWGSSLSGKTKANKGDPLPIEITGLSLSSCSGCPFSGSTTAEASKLPYSGWLARSSGGDGTLTIYYGAGGTPTLKVKCVTKFVTFTCAYRLSDAQAAFDGGNTAWFSFYGLLKRVEGSEMLCGSEPEFEATYELTGPKPAYAVASPEVGGIVFCKEATSTCALSSIYPPETTFEAEDADAVLDSDTQCDATLAFENLSESADPFEVYVQSMAFSNCTEKGCVGAGANPEQLPFGWSAIPTTNGNGQIVTNFKLARTCSGKKCEYETVNIKATFNGGSTPSIETPSIMLSKISGPGEFCGETWTIEPLKYEISTPTPLYLNRFE